MTTFTASLHNATVKSLHTGVQHVSSNLPAVGATGTASSVFLLVKVPHGAKIVDWRLAATCGSATNTFKLGTSASESALSTTFSLSGSASTELNHSVHTPDTSARIALLPAHVSLSDDREPRWVWIQAVAVVDICATASMHFDLWYKNDADEGGAKIR